MDKVTVGERTMKIWWLCAVGTVGMLAGVRMASHENILTMLLDMIPIVFISLSYSVARQVIGELKEQPADQGTTAPEPTAEPETPAPTPPEEE